MSVRKVKDSPKIFVSDEKKVRAIILKSLNRITDIVGRTLGPSGRIIGIESDYFGIPNKMTKDGVTVFNSLGAEDPYELFVMEQVRAAAGRTASEAGDGTTTATVLAAALINNLLDFCDKNKHTSPQRVVRVLNKVLKNKILPSIEKKSIKVNFEKDNMDLLRQVAVTSSNGDELMAKAVIEAFETVGFGQNSHVTIQEASGGEGYSVELVNGYPIQKGYEESQGRYHTAFINDQANIRCVMEKPLFLIFDGIVSDLVPFTNLLETMAEEYVKGNGDYKNLVFVSHGFSESVLINLAMNFANGGTMNIFPLVSPMNAVVNSQMNFLQDLSAFTGAKVFGMTQNVRDAQPEDFGKGMSQFESYRFRSTVVGEPDETDIEVRAEVLKKQLDNPESIQAKIDLEERLGKLTTGISKLTIYAGSSGELKEKHDRAEDAVCAVRATIIDGALPGGCRILTSLAKEILGYEGTEQELKILHTVLVPSLLVPLERLLDNAGYNKSERTVIMNKLWEKEDQIYDVENEKYGTALELGVYDAARAVSESIKNSFSIAAVMGVMGGIVCYPRDGQLEREEASKDLDYKNAVENPTSFADEVSNRI